MNLKITLSIFSFLFTLGYSFSQAPEKMSYQSVLRGTNNALITNQNVFVKISILQGTISGTSVYVETHSTSTNSNGLVSLSIGGGTVVSGSFSAINWANGPYFVQMEADPTGGTNYTISGTTQLLSVPYALYAKTSESSQNSWNSTGNTGTDPLTNFIGTTDAKDCVVKTNNIERFRINSGGSVGIGTATPAAKLDVSGTVKIADGTEGAGKVLTSDASGNATWQSSSAGKTVRGTSSAGFSPTVINGSGFTATRSSAGAYSIIFATPFTTTPTVTASVYNTNSTYLYEVQIVKISGVTANGFTIYTFGGSNFQLVDWVPFSFIAIGN